MLCLNIKDGEWVQIGEARVKILEIDKGRIRLGIEAPRSIEVLRQKLMPTIIRRETNG
jgi:carbon storage regulator